MPDDPVPDDPSRDEDHSVTCLLMKLRSRDQEAANDLWTRYFSRLIPLAKSKLGKGGNVVSDAEDVLISVFDRFFQAVEEDRFARLEDRNDLWQILLMLTERKVRDQQRARNAQKRGAGQVALQSELGEYGQQLVAQVAQEELSPEFAAAFNDFLARAILRLEDDKVRDVAVLRLEGYSNAEIAQRLEVSESTVERKLRVVRELWAREFD